jgi:hypothetical protein
MAPQLFRPMSHRLLVNWRESKQNNCMNRASIIALFHHDGDAACSFKIIVTPVCQSIAEGICFQFISFHSNFSDLFSQPHLQSPTKQVLKTNTIRKMNQPEVLNYFHIIAGKNLTYRSKLCAGFTQFVVYFVEMVANPKIQTTNNFRDHV